MKCINCGSEWNATGQAAVSIVNCPFCGESPVVKKAEKKSFETSKEALEAIYKQFGADILLGKLNAYIADFAPSLSTANKRLVNSVYEFGASKVLKENLNGSQEDKERAVKIAVRNMTDAFVKDDIAENIIYEFTNALEQKLKKIKSPSNVQAKTKTEEDDNHLYNDELEEIIRLKKEKTLTDEEKYEIQAEANAKEAIKKYEDQIIPLREAAVGGSPQAQFELGKHLSRNWKDKEAIEWFQKAAEQGHIEAQNSLGDCYASDNYGQKDIAKAIEWYSKAAAQGHNMAKFNLNLLRNYGKK